METFNIYEDIAKRTGGDIYLGVVGPVRTGKSTFIKKFMETLVLPNITDMARRQRVIDELPQSADGKTIMTTEPKFVPDEGVRVDFGDNLSANVRLIDCVGYVVDGAEGYKEGENHRYVHTPWSEEEMTFRDAAELGTRKVIVDHSTVGIVVTTDGSIAGLSRNEYIEAEERIVTEMKELGKPFVIILNSARPEDKSTHALRDELCEKYGVSVIILSVINMTRADADNVLRNILLEFPVRGLEIDVPEWMKGLNRDNQIIDTIIKTICLCSSKMRRMADYKMIADAFADCDFIDKVLDVNIDFGTGIICAELKAIDSLFYSVLSDECGIDINSDFALITYIKRLRDAEKIYDKMNEALNSVNATGYGVVSPELCETVVDEPVIVKKNGKYSVRIKAKAPSLHIMKVDVETDICPITGSEEQCNELLSYIKNEAEKPEGIMKVNMFGKSLDTVISDNIHQRLTSLTLDTEMKMCRTMTRIVNEGKGGVLCVLL